MRLRFGLSLVAAGILAACSPAGAAGTAGKQAHASNRLTRLPTNAEVTAAFAKDYNYKPFVRDIALVRVEITGSTLRRESQSGQMYAVTGAPQVGDELVLNVTAFYKSPRPQYVMCGTTAQGFMADDFAYDDRESNHAKVYNNHMRVEPSDGFGCFLKFQLEAVPEGWLFKGVFLNTLIPRGG